MRQIDDLLLFLLPSEVLLHGAERRQIDSAAHTFDGIPDASQEPVMVGLGLALCVAVEDFGLRHRVSNN